MNINLIYKIIKEEINRAFENTGPGGAKPPQSTNEILPGGETKSKIYGGSTLDLDVDGQPNYPKKLGSRDVYKKARKKQEETAAVSRVGTLGMSEGLRYHIDRDLPLNENVYRPGTKDFFDLFNEARTLWTEGRYAATEAEYEMFKSDIGEWTLFEGKMVPLDFPMFEESLDEAKYKGRTVKLGKAGASRSGGRAHVYVRNPKTGKIIKVSFGSGMPDPMGSSDAHKKRRKSFGDRHGCSSKNDKTKAGYWACRSTKLFGRNIPGWW